MKRLILFISVTVLSVASLQAQVNLDSGLVAYYPFNGNAYDESGNGYNGTVVGATLVKDRFDKGNSAYQFSGNDFIDIGDKFNDLSLPFTFSCWIYKSTLSKFECIFHPCIIMDFGYGRIVKKLS